MKKAVTHWRPAGLHERPGLSADDLDAVATTLPRPITGQQREEFLQRLGWIAAQYRLEEAWKDAPPPSEVRKRLEGIRRACLRLTTRLGVAAKPDADVDTLDQLPALLRQALVPAADRYGESIGGYADHPPTEWRLGALPDEHMDYHGDSKLALAVEHVQMLAAWCEDAIRMTRQREEGAVVERINRHGAVGRQARNAGNEPLNDMIARLGSLYRDTTGRPPGIARPRSLKRKPGGPFVRFVLAVCERMQIPMTATALEKRWRSLADLVRVTEWIEKVL